MQVPSFRISSSLVNNWFIEKGIYLVKNQTSYNERIGQSFYNWFNLHKMKSTENAMFLDALYEAKPAVALKMIDQITDYEN